MLRLNGLTVYTLIVLVLNGSILSIALSAFPFTVYETPPRYNKGVYIWAVMGGGFVFYSFMILCYIAQFPMKRYGSKNAIRIAFPIAFTVAIALTGVVHLSAYLGLEVKFYLLFDLFCMVLTMCMTFLSELGLQKNYTRRKSYIVARYREENDPDRKIRDQSQMSEILQSNKRRRGVRSRLKGLVIAGTCACTMLLYPIIIVPTYLSDNVPDWARLVFVLLVHPALTEGAMMLMRLVTVDVSNTEKKRAVAFERQLAPFALEFYLALVRRCLLSAFRVQAFTIVAILLTGIEEVLLRSTLKTRDQWLSLRKKKRSNSLRYEDKRDPGMIELQSIVWMTAVNHSM